MTRETAGKIYSDTISKQQDKATIFEFVEAIGNDLMPKLLAMVEKDKLKTDKDFFVEVCILMNPVLVGVPEFKMISRHTCPTPFPDRAAFHYDKRKDALFFLWHVPSMDECEYYVAAAKAKRVRPDELEAYHNAMAYIKGDLLMQAKKLNGEINDYELNFFRKDNDGRAIES